MNNAIRDDVIAYIDEILPELWSNSLEIHQHPELGFEEYFACQLQTDILKKSGFDVYENIGNLETAFLGTFKNGNPRINVGIVSEYDALPIGHACGHNLICMSSIGTALAVKKMMKKHNIDGKITIIGTPAEEGGGGKIILLEKGVFKGIDCVYMMHPTSDKTRLAGACLSSKRFEITFNGKVAHAASHPDKGINALSIANTFYTVVNFQRQHLGSDSRISIIYKEAGETTGLIPDKVTVVGSFSCFKERDLKKMHNMIENAANGAALAFGCWADIKIMDGYLGRVPNEILSEKCKEEFAYINEPLLLGMPHDFGGEDLGNVSRKIPICNPYVTIFPDYKISNHTQKFKELAASDNGKRCIEVTAKAMSNAILELFFNPKIVEDAKLELKQRMKEEVE